MRIVLAWAAVLVGVTGLALDWSAIFPSVMTVSEANPVARSFPDAFIYFWTYFTHLTNLWLIVTYVAVLSGWRWLAWFRTPVMMGSAAAFITLVMLYYHFMLAPSLRLEGALGVATYLLHYIAPILYLVWWTAFAPHGRLRFAYIPLMLLPGIGYVAWVLVRGALVNEYPYDILDAGRFGYLAVAIGVGVLLVAVSVFSVIIVAGDRWFARRQRPA